MRDFYYYLNKGKFGGAGLDITSKKIMNKKIFIDPKKNFIITDHLAGLTTDNHRRIKFFNKNLHLYCKNKSLINRVSIKKQY